jgi:hypothetical protein
MAGLLLLWLMIEHVCSSLTKNRVALFSNNSPTVSWVQQMVCQSSLIAEQLICVLALRINAQRSCPLTMLHIAGDQNTMTDIPSRSFGSESKWHFKTKDNLLTFFNASFPLSHMNSCSVCQPTSKIAMRVISILRIVPFTLEDWRRLPAVAKILGPLASLYGAFGSGTISSEHKLLNANADPIRIHGTRPHRILW